MSGWVIDYHAIKQQCDEAQERYEAEQTAHAVTLRNLKHARAGLRRWRSIARRYCWSAADARLALAELSVRVRIERQARIGAATADYIGES